MAIFLGIIQFLLIGIISVIELRKKSPAVFLWGTLALMYGVMHLFSSIMHKTQYPKSALIDTSIFVILFCLLYLMTRVFLSKLSGRNFNKFNTENLKKHLLNTKTTLLSIIFMLIVLRSIYVLATHSGGLFSSSWSVNREYATGLGYLSIDKILKIIFFTISGLPFITYIQKKYKLTAIMILMVVFSLIVTRNRIEILPIAVFMLMLVIFKKNKIKISTILTLGLIGFFVIYGIYGIRIFRHAGTVDNFLSMYSVSSFNDRVFEHISTDNGDLGLRRHFYYFMSMDNNFNGFGQAATYLRMLMIYVPTRLAGGLKPSDFAVTMGAAVGASVGGSIHPTLFGDAYANLGWLGITLGIYWAVFAEIGDRIILSKKSMMDAILIYVIFAINYVVIGRGSVYNGFVYIAYGIPIIIISRYMYRLFPFKFVLRKKSNLQQKTNA